MFSKFKISKTIVNISLFLVFTISVILTRNYFEYFVLLITLLLIFLSLVTINRFSKGYGESALVLILVITLSSFINTEYQLKFYLIFLILNISFFLIFSKYYIQEFIISLNYLNTLSWQNIFFISVVIFSILFQGIYYNGNFLAYDLLHPLGSMSIGNSLENYPFEDLAFSGNNIRYNFLSEKLPILYKNLFNLNILSALYFHSKLLIIIFLLIFIFSFEKEFSTKHLPLIFIFFFPIYFHSFDFTSYDTLFNRTIGFTNSYLIATSLIIAGLYFILKKRTIFLTINLSLLIMIKAQFFLVLYGCYFLYCIRLRNFNQLFIISIITIPLFLFLYYLFINGSNIESHWILFPQILVKTFPGFLFDISLDFHPIKILYFLFYFFILFICLYIYFLTNNHNFILLSSLVLSGIIGWSLTSELVYGSSTHFYNAITFASTYIIYISIFHTEIIFKNNIVITNNIFTSLIKKAIFIVPFLYVVINLSNNPVFYSILFNELKVSYYIQEKNLTTYNWLSNYEIDGTILSGTNYYQTDNDRLVRMPFVQSSLISKQLFFESNDSYRGNALHPGAINKMSEKLFFLQNFVEMNKQSKNYLDDYTSNPFNLSHGFYTSSFFDESKTSNKAKILYFLSFKKNWSSLNSYDMLSKKLENKISNLNNIKDKNNWLSKFLLENQIKIIILHNNDTLNSSAQNYVKEIFKYKDNTIYEVVN